MSTNNQKHFDKIKQTATELHAALSLVIQQYFHVSAEIQTLCHLTTSHYRGSG